MNLVDPEGFEGGAVKFFSTLGQKDPDVTLKAKKGCGVTFCGCDRNIHAVDGVTSGLLFFKIILILGIF